MPERDLRDIFERFGKVQTCIVNTEKRHAFVKMLSRDDALKAKEAMEKNRTPDSQLRVCNLAPAANLILLTFADSMGRRIWAT
jgi:RNA recognition motif-containing protein